jgi:general L-amino acid transport system permease protein
MPAIRTLCTIYVELIRGVPLISVLFMASFMFPLFMPPAASRPTCWCASSSRITLFAGAYMAEIVRGGLQTLGKGQVEAAPALGLGYWQTQRKIVLPQALARGAQHHEQLHLALQGHLAGDHRQLYELTGALSLAVGSDPNWRPFKIEATFHRRHLLHLLLFDVALQPVDGTPSRRGQSPLNMNE